MADGETLSAVRTGGARSCAAVTSAALAERMAELGMLHAASCMLCVASCMLCVACCALHVIRCMLYVAVECEASGVLNLVEITRHSRFDAEDVY
jgi:hypothetical protein